MDNSSFNNPSKIIGIQFSIFSPEEIEKYSVVEVTNKETYVGIKPKIGGLFDPRMGVSEPGMICPTDGMNYINSPGYFGHVKLCKPIFYIQYLNMVIDILKCVCNKCGKLLISKKTYQSLTKYPAAKRWQKVLELCKNPQLKRCGDETDNGCGCMRATKIKQEGFATIVAEWINQTESYTLKITPEMAINILKKISDEDVNFMGFSNIWSRPEWMICKTFAVPPPAVRPSVKHDAQQRSEDDLTHIIINIIKINNKIKQLTESGEQDNQKNIDDWIQVLQYYIATMVDNNISGASPVTQRSGRALKSISERHKGKQGRVRGNLMGKRVDFSARSVITPDPELSISELGVPMKIAKNITKPVKVQNFNYKYLSYLVKNGPHKYPGAKLIEKPNGITISLGYIDRDNVKIEIGDIVHRHMLDGDVVLFNRQPTLHRMSMMAHIVKVMPVGDTFRMNVADTKPYNADFDGDEMNMHMPQNDEAECELRYLANVPNHIISPGNNKPIVGIFQDSMVGSFLYTRENISFTKKQAMNLLVKTNCFKACNLFDDEKEKYSSFEVLSEIIPNISLKYKTDLFTDNESVETSNHVLEINDGKIVRGQHDKGVFGSSSKGIIHRIRKDFGSEACKDYIDNLQAIITEYMKTTGFSVGISDLIADEETKQKINSIIQEKKNEVSNLIDQVHIGLFENKTGKSNLEEFETQVNNILNKASNDAGKAGIRSLDKENRFVSIVTSGSKGNELNISQMISCLGQQNVDGKRIPYGYTNRTLPHFKQFDDTPKARGFVESSFISGLSPDELFFHAMGGRVGLIDTAVKTSTTGYIQRRLIKGMEDIQVMYDNTIRNNKNKVIQFSYGGTNWDTTMIESMQFQLVDNKTIDIYKNYSYEFMNEFQDTKIKQSRKNTHLKLIYDSKALSKFKEQKENLKEKCLADIKYLLGKRDEMVINVYNNEDENKIYLPVHFTNIIERVKNHFQITTHSLSNITPLEAYKIIERKYDVLKQTFKPCEKFKIAYTYYMNPYNLIHNHKYHKDAIVFLCESIINIYKQSLVNPGEMVGMVGAQSIGEPTTQMSLHADEKIRIIKCLRGTEEYETMTVKIGEFCDSIIQDNPHQTFNTGYQDSVETILEGDDYFVVGVNGKEKTAWNRISHVSKHPVNGELMKVTTRSGRTVRTTTSHSHLVRRNQTVEPITGSDMKVGMRIPVCKQVDTPVGKPFEVDKFEFCNDDSIDRIDGLFPIVEKCATKLGFKNTIKSDASISRTYLNQLIMEIESAYEDDYTDSVSSEIATLRQAADADVVWDEVVSIEIYTPDQNEYVYDFTVPKTQTFMVDNGIIVHNTLNTFHFAGISSKSNVTRGVPRIEELLTLTKKPKNPSLTIYLDQETSMDANASYNIASKIEHIRLINIVNKAEIYYEPQEFESLIDEDDKLMKEYVEFSDIIRKCYDEEEDGEDGDEELDETNNWIIRLELNGTQMFDMNITNEDVHYILKTECPALQGSSNNIKCFYTDYNDSDKIVFRIRVNIDSKRGKKKKDVFTEEDYIHYVKTYMDKILNELVIRGTKNIEKVNLRKINNYKIMNHETGDFDKKEMYVLDTIGTNLSDILKLDYIDKNKTFSNDIIEMKNILGIEAARRCLFNEILEVMEFDSTYINHHHIHLLCDRMTCNHKMVSIFRHGINKDDIGPIAKASFEETTEMFLQAARHGELDNMRGVSANVMCGQEGYYGTSSFQIHIDNDLLKKNNEELGLLIEDVENNEVYADELMEPEEVMNLEEEKNNKNNDKCSLENLKTASTLSSISKNKIIDNDYNLDI